MTFISKLAFSLESLRLSERWWIPAIFTRRDVRNAAIYAATRHAMARAMALPLLTLEAMDADRWNAALNFPVPHKPDLILLDTAIAQVPEYLAWVTDDILLLGHPDVIEDEINHASARLLELCRLRHLAFYDTGMERGR
jgi:hypothetical protein